MIWEGEGGNKVRNVRDMIEDRGTVEGVKR